MSAPVDADARSAYWTLDDQIDNLKRLIRFVKPWNPEAAAKFQDELDELSGAALSRLLGDTGHAAPEPGERE